MSSLREFVLLASSALALKVLAALFGFLFSAWVAKILGAEQVGLFFLGLAIANILSMVGRLGLDDLVVRSIARNREETSFSWLHLYLSCLKIVFTTAGGISLLLYLSTRILSEQVFHEPGMALVLQYMSFSVLPFSMGLLHASFLKATGRVQSYVTIFSVALPGWSLLWWMIFQQDLEGALKAHLLGVVCLFLHSSVLLFCRGIPFSGNEPQQSKGVWLIVKEAQPLFWIYCLQMVNRWAPMLFLGIVFSSRDVGVFAMANRTAMLLSFGLFAVTGVVAPKLSRYYGSGQMMELQKMLRWSMQILVVYALPMLVLMIAFAPQIMGFFGPEFEKGALLLVVLATGQFINVCFGPLEQTLVMTGYEKLLRNIQIVCTLILIFVGGLLILEFSTLGAAISIVMVILMRNLITLYFVTKKLNINPLKSAL